MSNQEDIYSVSQLNRAVKLLLADEFAQIQVAGEISNLSIPSSGHIYFSLKDPQAQVRCAMFKTQRQRLRFKPDNGLQVVVTAQVGLYEPRGDYQLIVEHIEEAGDGLLRQAFERLKQKLFQEGLFDESAKQPIPQLPKQIGVITSATGAAIHDILTVLKRRFPAIPVILYPVAVQGENAKHEIAGALATANQHNQVDVIILGRGGGSLEDLWAFNEEIVARAIAASQIPVISAVGHEVDVTIADFVADYRAATPSAAAEYAVPHQNEWLNSFYAYEKILAQLIGRQLQQNLQQISWLSKRLQQQHPGEKLLRNHQRLDELELRLNQALNNRLRHLRQQLAISHHQLRSWQPSERITRCRQQLNYADNRLQRAMQAQFAKLRNQSAHLSQTLHTVSPLATMDRGYAIVQRKDDSSVVKSKNQLQIDDLIQTRLADGMVVSKVNKLL